MEPLEDPLEEDQHEEKQLNLFEELPHEQHKEHPGEQYKKSFNEMLEDPLNEWFDEQLDLRALNH